MTEQEIINRIILFLNARADELNNAGIQHFREVMALKEAAILIEMGEWKKK